MTKKMRAVFALALVLAISSVYDGLGKTGSVAIGQTGTQPPEKQQALVPRAGFEVIQEFPLPKDCRVVPRDMKVKGDGHLVLYIVGVGEGEKPEYDIMLNGRRVNVAGWMAELDKFAPERSGRKTAPESTTTYRYDEIAHLSVSPDWKNFVHTVTVKGFLGPIACFYFITEITTPFHYDEIMLTWRTAGYYPSFITVSDERTMWGSVGMLYWTPLALSVDQWGWGLRWTNKNGMREHGEGYEFGSSLVPAGPILFSGMASSNLSILSPNKNLISPSTFATVVIDRADKTLSMYEGNETSVLARKVLEGYEAIEPVFRPGSRTISYIAKKGKRSVLAVDGKVQATQFIPVRGLTFSPKGDVYAYAATAGGREFAIRNGARVKKDGDFSLVSSLALDPAGARVAYVARNTTLGGKDWLEWIVVEDRKVTPAYSYVVFNREVFEESGEVVFAGCDARTRSIVVGRVKAPAQ